MVSLLSLLVATSTAHAAPTAVSLRSSDGLKINTLVEVPKGATRGVIYLHMQGRDGTDFSELAERMVKSGLASAAPDLRGHGKSDKAGQELSELDYQGMLLDGKAVVAHLKSKGVTDLSCVGGALGANLCLNLAAEEPGIGNVVLLSPSLNAKGIATPAALKTYGNRPLLIVAAEDDPASVKAASMLAEQALGQVHVELYPQGGNGTKMLTRAPGLEGLVQSWLLGTYQLSSGAVVVPKPGMTVDSEVKTEGNKLSSHK